jgi:ABC-type glutathione transport system ATPase component
MNREVLQVEQACRHFLVQRGWLSAPQKVEALIDANLTMFEGECLGVIGESGSGKTTLARLIAGVLPASSGTVRVLEAHSDPDLPVGGQEAVQMVPQFGRDNLDPLMTAEELIAEAIMIHSLRNTGRESLRDTVEELMQDVGLDPSLAGQYPPQLSGGEMQRILIARAVARSPRLLILDEPVSALDVSVQGLIINLINEMRRRLDLSVLVISHDIAAIAHICQRIAVMKDGRIVEIGRRDEILSGGNHPYTRGLIQALRE